MLTMQPVDGAVDVLRARYLEYRAASVNPSAACIQTALDYHIPATAVIALIMRGNSDLIGALTARHILAHDIAQKNSRLTEK